MRTTTDTATTAMASTLTTPPRPLTDPTGQVDTATHLVLPECHPWDEEACPREEVHVVSADPEGHRDEEEETLGGSALDPCVGDLTGPSDPLEDEAGLPPSEDGAAFKLTAAAAES